jgi:hypothetical protein
MLWVLIIYLVTYMFMPYQCHFGKYPVKCVDGCRYMQTTEGHNVSLGCAYPHTKGNIFDEVIDIKKDLGPTEDLDHWEVQLISQMYKYMLIDQYNISVTEY